MTHFDEHMSGDPDEAAESEPREVKTAPEEMSCPVCDRLVASPVPSTCPHCNAPLDSIMAMLSTADRSLSEAMRDLRIGAVESALKRLDFVHATSKRHRLHVEAVRAMADRLLGNPAGALARIKSIEDKIEEVDEFLLTILDSIERQASDDQNALAACCEHYNFALFQAKRGHYEEAADSLRKGLRLVPHHASSHALMGKVMLGLGDENDARYHVKRALATDPTNPSASRTLAGLGRKVVLTPAEVMQSLSRIPPVILGSAFVIVLLVVIAIVALVSR